MINKLVANIRKTGAPIVVGLDPMLNYVPEHIQQKAFAEYGETLEGAAEAIWQFNKEIVDKTYDLIPAVKPQIAMYEQFGIPGLQAFKKTVDYCKSKGLVVIGDIKRGDIGSTSSAYAVGHVGKVQVGSKTYAPFDEDFVTVNPYLGSDGVNPFIKVCQEEKKGMFILVKTSNPSSGEFQDRLIDGRPLYELVGEKVAEWGEQHMGDEYSYVGAVVGATYPEMGKVLRKIMPKSYILVPGYGAVINCMYNILTFGDIGMKKKIAPIIAAAIIIVYLLVYVFVIAARVEFFLLKALLLIVPLWLIYTMTQMLLERLDEIEKGEDDDISNY